MIFLFLGFLIVLLGVVILIVAGLLMGGSSAGIGIVIFIGPIPVIIGAGQQSKWLVLFAIILTVLSIIMFAVVRKQRDKNVG